ncbi:hypothetical protein CO230_08690 [Chryseobacterium sp. 6424]|uniref:hypothetical protein n=1 Tax=Chryseobacterium sp. 6424 TaxID=2039166 RepID=UPI000EFD541B|nr:hypothetical protein [Chryseobacterium sp. 6424]AYO58191.1 hypothetical protein CO230_08690 [Chryseobacterium sp. 6424]
MYKLLSIVLFSLALGACSVKKQVTQSTEKTQETSAYKVEKYRDTVFYTPKSSTSFGIPIPSFAKCPPLDSAQGLQQAQGPEKPKVFSQKSGNAKATVRIEHDSIFIQAECDSLALEAKIKAEYEGKFQKESETSKTETKTQKGGIWGAISNMLIALALGFVLGKLIKI